MKILGIVGSMRRERHTQTLVTRVVEHLREQIPTLTYEVLHITDLTVGPCRVTCQSFCAANPYRCTLADDVASVLAKMIAADAVILGAPLYFRGPPTKFQSLIERIIGMFFSLEAAGSAPGPSPLRGKPCALVGVAEYTNPLQVLEYLHDFANLVGMQTVRVPYLPYLGVGGQGDIANDRIFKPFDRCREAADALAQALGSAAFAETTP